MQNIYCSLYITLVSSLLFVADAAASEHKSPKKSDTPVIKKMKTAAALAKTTLRVRAQFPIDYTHHASIRITSDTTLQIDRAGFAYPVSGDFDRSFDPVNGHVDFKQAQEEYEFSLATNSIRQTAKKESVIYWPAYCHAIQTIAASNTGTDNDLEILRKRFGSIIPAHYVAGCATSNQNLLATADRDGTVKIYSID